MNLPPTTSRGLKRPGDQQDGSATKHVRGGLSQSKLDDYLSNNIFKPLIDAPEELNLESVTSKTLKHLPPSKITQKLNNLKEAKQSIKQWSSGTVHFRSGKEHTEILVYSVTDHKLLQTKLKEENIQFFTFTPPSEIPKKLVIKGIDSSYSTDEILDDLQKQLSEHKITVVKVVPLLDKNGQSSANNPCLVYFNSNTNINFVTRSIRYCCDHRIKWDHFRTPLKNKGTQCRNCQRMGHVAKNCGLPYRCVKCTSQHLPGQCPKQKTDKPVCVNCSQYHTSNWRGCEVIKNYNDSKRESSRVNNQTTAPALPQVLSSQNTNQHRPRRLYSDVIKPKTPNPTLASHVSSSNVNASSVSASQSHSNSFSFLETEVNSLFNLKLSDLILKMRQFIPQYHSLSDNSEKQLMLLQFLFSVLK